MVKARDYLAARATGHAAPLSEHLRQPVFIPDTARSSALLEAFRNRSETRFAVVVDEYGDIMGIATLRDLLEAIVGDLPDQHDEGEPQAVAREDGSWLLDGLLPCGRPVRSWISAGRRTSPGASRPWRAFSCTSWAGCPRSAT